MKITLSEFLSNIKKYIKPGEEIFVIGITGGSGSGKSFISRKIADFLQDAIILEIDDYILDCRRI